MLIQSSLSVLPFAPTHLKHSQSLCFYSKMFSLVFLVDKEMKPPWNTHVAESETNCFTDILLGNILYLFTQDVQMPDKTTWVIVHCSVIIINFKISGQTSSTWELATPQKHSLLPGSLEKLVNLFYDLLVLEMNSFRGFTIAEYTTTTWGTNKTPLTQFSL